MQDLLSGMQYEYVPYLHLKTSIRSFRSEKVAEFVKAILDCDRDEASKLCVELNGKYPIIVTRDIAKAKQWLEKKSRANERFGLGYYQFIGKKWINIRDTDKILYLKNAYRVLLTRARQLTNQTVPIITG